MKSGTAELLKNIGELWKSMGEVKYLATAKFGDAKTYTVRAEVTVHDILTVRITVCILFDHILAAFYLEICFDEAVIMRECSACCSLALQAIAMSQCQHLHTRRLFPGQFLTCTALYSTPVTATCTFLQLQRADLVVVGEDNATVAGLDHVARVGKSYIERTLLAAVLLITPSRNLEDETKHYNLIIELDFCVAFNVWSDVCGDDHSQRLKTTGDQVVRCRNGFCDKADRSVL